SGTARWRRSPPRRRSILSAACARKSVCRSCKRPFIQRQGQRIEACPAGHIIGERGRMAAEIGPLNPVDHVAQRRAARVRQTATSKDATAVQRIRERFGKPVTDGCEALQQQDVHGFDEALLGGELIRSAECRGRRADSTATRASLLVVPISALLRAQDRY